MDTFVICSSPDEEAQVREIRNILKAALRLPPDHRKIGSVLAAIGKVCGGIELDITRDQTPAKPAEFDDYP